jgi:hypothetical protein
MFDGVFLTPLATRVEARSAFFLNKSPKKTRWVGAFFGTWAFGFVCI